MPMTIEFKQKGDFSKTLRFLNKAKNFNINDVLTKYGNMGVEALSSATPVRTGRTAASWSYDISYGDGSATISWSNSNVNNGVNIAVILQYGHGTGTGGWVEGIDYINPALKPVFDAIANDAWTEITRD